MTRPANAGARRREEFPRDVRRAIANRVQGRCSHPGCGRDTIGPHTNPRKATVAGEAAHICAALPGGPRYVASMTAEERRSESNAIWLCVRCHTIVDDDEDRFPADLLRSWKEQAEARAQQRLDAPYPVDPGRALAALADGVADLQRQVAAAFAWRPGAAMEAVRGHVAELERLNPAIAVNAVTESTGTVLSIRLRAGYPSANVGTLTFPATKEGRRGEAKFRRMQETGRATTLVRGEFNWVSAVRGLCEGADTESLAVAPQVPDRTVPLRLTFEVGSGSLAVPYAGLKLVQRGTKRTVLQISIPRLQITFTVVVELRGRQLRSKVSYRYDLVGLRATDAYKAARVLHAVASSARMSVYALESEGRLFSATWHSDTEQARVADAVARMMHDVGRINDALGTDFRCPLEVFQRDIDMSHLLASAVETGEFVREEHGMMSENCLASEMARVLEFNPNNAAFALEKTLQGPLLFGAVVDVGRVEARFEGAHIEDFESVIRRVAEARDDEVISFDVRYQRIRYQFSRRMPQAVGPAGAEPT